MENKDKVLIVMRDNFLLGLYKTAFSVRGFDTDGVIDDNVLIKTLKTAKPELAVLEKKLNGKVYEIFIDKVNNEHIPVLILTKQEELGNIKEDLSRTIYDYGDIMNDDLSEIIRRGENLIKRKKKL